MDRQDMDGHRHGHGHGHGHGRQVKPGWAVSGWVGWGRIGWLRTSREGLAPPNPVEKMENFTEKKSKEDNLTRDQPI
jgi:hypothetical protein